jgi:flagellar hook-basal body protein
MQGDTYSPAATSSQTVYDQQGNARQITFLFYQVNDLGDGGINSASGPSQAAYAWYAFDTTGGQSPSNTNLLGGTSILEGEVTGQNPQGFNRGIWGDQYTGDLLYFNTDGSLASPGANDINQLGDPPRADIATTPRIYLPTTQTSDSTNGGDGVTSISISFGTIGQKDGVYSDATGSYSGSVYTAQSKVQEISQDGYAEGVLKTLSVNKDGVILGDFSNGQTGIELARISLARFSNPEGLSRTGDNYYTQSANSGPLEMEFAGEGNVGTIQSGALEASNVDLSQELTNMIIAQRCYEMNSKTIGVSSDNWKTANEMKR